jgi:hypothetical protein
MMMMTTPMIPTTAKTPASRGLFWKKDPGVPVPTLVWVDEEASMVVVKIAGVTLKLEVMTGALLDVENELTGVEVVDEMVDDLRRL